MKRIIVSVSNDLITDQRLHRVCASLTAQNYKVLLIGRKLKNSEDLNREYKIYRFKLLFNKGVLFYAEFNLRLFFKLFFLKKDILLSNDLDTLLPNFLISRVSKTKLVYDSHELFTEVPELINRHFVQNIWLKLEKLILPNLKNCYTVCSSIANYYNLKYNTNFKVIRNLPISTTKMIKGKFCFETTSKKIILYQGAINKGRGLELLIEAMAYIDDSILVLIGNGDVKKSLLNLVDQLSVNSKVKFISRKTPEELKKLTCLADLGISIEEDFGLNYKYALPNKLFDYIHATIPVLVSDLPEMKQIVLKYDVGEVVEERNPKALSQQIKTILKKEKSFYNNQLQKAKKELNWEKESVKLKNIFENLN